MNYGLQNNRGQALIEATLVTTVFCSGLFFVLAVFHTQIVSIAVDDSIETYFFCQIQKKSFCKQSIEDTLNQLKLINPIIQEGRLNTDYEITIEADTKYHYRLSKKRRFRFDFDLQI